MAKIPAIVRPTVQVGLVAGWASYNLVIGTDG